MALSRRAFIRIAGGAAVFAAAGVGLNRCDRMPEAAVAGWQGPPAGETEPRRRALSYALLAPNPHNLQSWIADLSVADEIRLFVDPARLLPATDPFSRQIVVGCGCFLETLVLAAAMEGWKADVAPGTGEDAIVAGTAPFATVRFVAGARDDAGGLGPAILKRRSVKTDYDGRALSEAHVASLMAAHGLTSGRVSISSEAGQVVRLREIGMAAMRVEVNLDRTYAESVRVMRIGANEIAAHRDGLSFHGPMFWWAKQFGLMSPEAQMAPESIARNTARALLDTQAASTATFGWVTTPANDRAAQIAAGRAYARLNLAAAWDGVALAPWSQALQEFPEMAAQYAALRAAVGAGPGETVQMFFRLGYAGLPEPTPRRALDAIIRA
ncbi:MAG: hypothetical protein QM698_15290 [Micropepsaceae bacterium]